MVKHLYNFITDIYKNRRMIFSLAKKDFKSKYLGNYLGIIWAFIQPTFMILIYWFVFQVGFKSNPVENFPFVLWLISGIIPWFFFSDAMTSAMNSIVENSYLVKKVVFKVSALPLIKIIGALFIHLFFVFMLFLLFFLYGYSPSLYQLQVFYYLICMIALVLSLSWITSSLVVFIKDFGQLISMFLQIFYWMTPIFWSFNVVPTEYQFIFKLNPLFYIIEGYRDSMIHQVGFWHHYYQTIYFWSVVLVFSTIGMFLYKKLKPHFADVL
ncbi:MAG: ABC transporter permease [Bacillota bacterium]